ncbi:MAG: crossover junction endodeoxyribonuclease RuvC [Bacteroidia bacterium]|nr:crossover junction endodeoxyribonuclease RuvC [Bacteroidia bacterium]
MYRWIGVDLGSQAVGFGVVEQKEGGYVLASCEALHLPPKALRERLSIIHAWLKAKIQSHLPAECIAMEAPFVGKNARSALTLGLVQGLLWGILLENGQTEVFVLSPAEIKRAITGRPHAPKAQVAAMLPHHLKLYEPLPNSDHATDAAAIALAAAYLQNSAITRRLTKRAER